MHLAMIGILHISMDGINNSVACCIVCENVVLITRMDMNEVTKRIEDRGIIEFAYRSVLCRRCETKITDTYGHTFVGINVIGIMCVMGRPSYKRVTKMFRYTPRILGTPYHVVEHSSVIMNEVLTGYSIYHVTMDSEVHVTEYTDGSLY